MVEEEVRRALVCVASIRPLGAAEDDRPKIKGLFWVVLVFGRA